MGGRRDRRSIRLPGYDDNRPGAYFLTICAWHRRRLFGQVEASQVALSQMGEVVRQEWLRTARIRPEIDLDEFIIMPDHIHGIIVIREGTAGADRFVGAHRDAPPLRRPPRSLGSIIQGSKGR